MTSPTFLNGRHKNSCGHTEEGLRDGSGDFSPQNTNLLPVDLPIHGASSYRQVSLRITLILDPANLRVDSSETTRILQLSLLMSPSQAQRPYELYFALLPQRFAPGIVRKVR